MDPHHNYHPLYTQQDTVEQDSNGQAPAGSDPGQGAQNYGQSYPATQPAGDQQQTGQSPVAGAGDTGVPGTTTGAPGTSTTMPGQTGQVGVPASSDSATSTGTGYALPPPATFLGIPVDGILVFTPLFIAGVLVYAWLAGRTPHTEQLTRLDKQRKRMEAREAAKPESVDIFKNEKVDFLGKLLSQAGLEAQYDEMKTKWIASAIGTMVGLFGLAIWQAPALAPFAIILGPALGSFGFVQYIKYQANQRQKRLTAQLPQVLETMVSTLKAGSPVVECIKLLSETAPEPIRAEFRRALVSMQLGKPFRDVLAEMGTRIRTADFRLLTQAIFISQDVGANLADVVATIADAIRERFRLRDFLNSLTAQGKMTALFIGSLPYFITAMTYVMAPGYITPFLNHPVARIVFIVMMLWEGIGAWILVKMTTFEV